MKQKNRNHFAEIFKEEFLRGEKVNWMLHWFLYGIVLLLSCVVYFVQGIKVGKYGIILSLINLLYNSAVTPFIFKEKKISWNGYVMVMINVVSLSTYNFLDGYFISPMAPVTTAAIMLYPIIIFLASLRMDKKLIVWATIASIVFMDGIYFYFFKQFDPAISPKIVSSDLLGQLYRTVYLALSGVLMYQVPSMMLRVLKTQERLTQESMANKRIAQQDALTGVYNRLYFDQHLKNSIELAAQFNYKIALFYIDLDGFKVLNDTLGHDAGDFVLKAVASALSETIRDTDIVARLGGDEFVVVMSPLTNENKKQDFVLRLLESIGKKRTFNGKEIVISASIGGAIYPDDAITSDQLTKCADEAMYSVKKSGKKNGNFYKQLKT
jgi:diguanylate cyclase (GGDEF)-like protein